MKKTIFRFLCLMLVCALGAGALISCGKGNKPLGKGEAVFSDVYRADPEMGIDSGYKTHTLKSLPERISETQKGGAFYSYFDAAETTYRVYNVDLDKNILNIPAANISRGEDITLFDEYVSVVTKTAGEESTSVYGESGELLATVNGREALTTGNDCFMLAGKLYHVEDGALKKTYTVPSLFVISDVRAFTDDYLICNTGRGAVYYNESFEVVALYEVPEEVVYFKVTPLAGGKLFINYEISCDISSDDYDCYVDYQSEGQSKFNIYNSIFDPATGKEKTLDLGNIAVIGIYNEYNTPFADVEFHDAFTDKVDNILGYYLIKDRQITRARTYAVLLDNDGNVGAALDSFVEGQRGIPQPFSKNSYRVQTATGYAFLDTAGKVLAEARSVSSLKVTDYGLIREVYEAGSNKIYVYGEDLSLKLTLDAANVTNRYSNDEGVLLYTKNTEDGNKHYCYSRAGEREIIAPEGYTLYEYGNMTVKNGIYSVPLRPEDSYTTVYAYYNYDGEHLFTAESMTVLAEGENAALITYQDVDGDWFYARLAK